MLVFAICLAQICASRKEQTNHLKTNNTTTNDNHLLRHLSEGKSTGAGNNALLIDVETGEGSGLGAGSNQDVLAADGLLATLVQGDLNSVGINKRTGTLNVVDAVLLQQELDTLGQTVNGLILGLHHLVQVELDIANFDTAFLSVVENLVVQVGVVEQRL